MAISFVLDLTQVDSKRSKYVCRLCLCKSLTVKHSFLFRVFLSSCLNHLELLSFLFFLFFSLVQYHCHLIKGNMKCGFNLWVRICTLHRNIMIVWPIKWNFFGAFLNNAADFFSFLFFFFLQKMIDTVIRPGTTFSKRTPSALQCFLFAFYKHNTFLSFATVYFSGKKWSLLHPKTSQRSFCLLQFFPRNTLRKIGPKSARKYWVSISDRAHAPWYSLNLTDSIWPPYR